MRTARQIFVFVCSFALVSILGGPPASGQDDPPSGSETVVPAQQPISAAQIELLLQQAEAATDLEDDAKNRVLDLLRQSLQEVEQTAQYRERAATLGSARETAASRAEELTRNIEALKSADREPIDESLSLQDLEQQLDALTGQVDQFKQRTSDADADISNRTARRNEIRDRLVAAGEQREGLQSQLGTAAADGESAIASQARQTETRTRFELINAEIASLEAELSTLDAEDALNIPPLRRDEVALRLTRSETGLQELRGIVQDRRAMEASEQIEKATEEARGETNPWLRLLAEDNVEMAEQFRKLNEQLNLAEQELIAAKVIRDRVTDLAEDAKAREREIGLTDSVGIVLRQLKRTLPDPRAHRANIRRLATKISNVQFDLMDLEAKRSLQVTATEAVDDEQWAELLSKSNELLSSVTRVQRSYFQTLGDLSSVEEQIVRETTEFASFIDERIFWVRSGKPLLSTPWFDGDNRSLLSTNRFSAAAGALMADAKSAAIWYVLAAIVFLTLLLNRGNSRARIRQLGETAEHGSCIDFSPTVRATSHTILASLPWPGLFAFLAWRLSRISINDDLVKSIAQGLASVALVYFPLEFLRKVCQAKGLAESHFGWTPNSVALMRTSVRWLMLVGLPLIFLMSFLNENIVRSDQDGIERIAFIAVCVALSLFVSRVMHPQRGIFGEYLMRHADGWASRLRGLWYWMIVAGPLALAGLAFQGYSYTAHQLAWRFYATGVLVATLFVAASFVTRILLVQRRRISIEQARRRLAARQDNGSSHAAADGEAEFELPDPQELRAQVAQSRSLLQLVVAGLLLIGVWMTWADVLPALGRLDRWPVWTSTVSVTEMSTDSAGAVSFTSRNIPDVVSITDVLFAILIATITALAARNIPGVLEISVLQRLPIEASVRYAIKTVVSYLIIVLGLIVAANAIGIHWQQIQWMAAALTFGLAFGLQEMFANFVAGIIILFERPVRVGDIVTVDNVTGTVSRVRIRATTITNWDRKDYLVPNKDFITGRVLNWTLSNRFNRIVIPIGVAYGSDKNETVRQLLRVAVEHPQIVDDPGPSVTFEAFADSSLSYVLRCYISMADMSSRLRIVHELHTAIDDAFRAANIEIPFPQQDLHLRSAETSLKIDSASESAL